MLLSCFRCNVEASCHTLRRRLPPPTYSAAYQRQCHQLAMIRRCWVYCAFRSKCSQHAMEPNIGSGSQFLPTPPAFDAPVRRGSCRNISSVGRNSEWEGLRSRRRRCRGGWGGVSPSPEKFCIFASKSHVCDALWHPFEVILLLVENEQQCTIWFILQCYRQPNIILFGGGGRSLAMPILSRAHNVSVMS